MPSHTATLQRTPPRRFDDRRGPGTSPIIRDCEQGEAVALLGERCFTPETLAHVLQIPDRMLGHTLHPIPFPRDSLKSTNLLLMPTNGVGVDKLLNRARFHQLRVDLHMHPNAQEALFAEKTAVNWHAINRQPTSKPSQKTDNLGEWHDLWVADAFQMVILGALKKQSTIFKPCYFMTTPKGNDSTKPPTRRMMFYIGVKDNTITITDQANSDFGEPVVNTLQTLVAHATWASRLQIGATTITS